MSKQQFIYFPSLSNGAAKEWFTKDLYISNNIPFRFYGDKMVGDLEKWKFPYFLLSAGHNMKHMNMREEMGLKDSLVLGDSGGYQLATGALKWKPEIRETIFNWLENNADISMILDIPPRGQYSGKFQEALEISLDNFKYFEKNQTGKTQFVNVLQGQGIDQEYALWYDKVKDFEFGGWGIAAARDVKRMAYTFALLLENGEFEKPTLMYKGKHYSRYFHYLGVSGIDHFLMLSIFQDALNTYLPNYNNIITTDSSTPNRATIFGTYYYDVNWKTLKYISLNFPKGENLPYKWDNKLPCRINCPACGGLTYESMRGFDANSMMIMTNHNVFMFVNIINQINNLINSHDEIIKTVLTTDYYEIYKSIHMMFTSGAPLKVYDKFKPLYQKVSSDLHTGLDINKMNDFFDFN